MSPVPAPALRRACSFAAAIALVACSPDTARGPLAPDAAALFARGAELPFHGTLDAATHTAQYDTETNTIVIHLGGTGTATRLGRYTLTSDLVLDAATLAGTERMTFTAADGDILTTIGTAQGIPSGDGVTLNSVQYATITGGTGRFADATGSFTLRQVNLAADRISSGSFEGTISLGEHHSR